MSEALRCFRCGASLEKLSLPLSRRDGCPECHVYLHVCRMCRHFDASVPRMCREDDAEDVSEKEKVNFCEWFAPSADAFDETRAGEASRARSALDALFGGEPEPGTEGDELTRQAEDLFK
jgi:hypothetical protein